MTLDELAAVLAITSRSSASSIARALERVVAAHLRLNLREPTPQEAADLLVAVMKPLEAMGGDPALEAAGAIAGGLAAAEDMRRHPPDRRLLEVVVRRAAHPRGARPYYSPRFEAPTLPPAPTSRAPGVLGLLLGVASLPRHRHRLTS